MPTLWLRCAAHVGAPASGRAAEYAADAAAAAEQAVAEDAATTVGYMAAHAAEAMAPGGFAAERRWQSRWLADRLGIPRSSGQQAGVVVWGEHDPFFAADGAEVNPRTVGRGRNALTVA